MTKIIGLTGGIGSGKTTVAKYFESLGVPVYVADDEGRKITDSEAVTKQIAAVFGNEILENGKVDRKKLSGIVFSDKGKLQQLNDIVHPAVRQHFQVWIKNHADAAFVIRESAILFESGSFADCDFIISVTAPIETRIGRVMKRDNVTRAKVLERIENQMTDEERISKSDFVIENTDLSNAEKQAAEILKNLSNIQN